MTMALSKRLVGGLLAALALALPLRADQKRDDTKRPPRAFVVLVGIDHSEDPAIKPRAHAEADAQALYDLLTDKKYLDAPGGSVRLFLGGADEKRHAERATRDNVLKALHEVARDARADDLVIFGFFGEGGPLGDSGDRRCYFAADSTFKGREKDALAAADVAEALKNLKTRRFCALVDVDFKGFNPPAGQTIAEPTLGTEPYKEFLGDDETEDHAPLPGRVVFLATNGLTRSLDLADHGVFAKAVLDGLAGAADKEGYEPDGLVTVDELADYLDKQVHELARQNGQTDKQKQQYAFVLGGRSNHFVLTSNPQARAKVQERLAKFAKLAEEGKVPAAQAEEGKNLLARMPKLEAQRELRKEYQALADGALTPEKFAEARTAILDKTRLRRTDALQFARRVLEATQIIKEGYVKDVSQGDMVGWALRGLYRRADEKVPAEIEERLKGVKELRETELQTLLTDARLALGRREDLDKHKDIDIALQRMLSHLDPYTTYVDPEQLERFKQEIRSKFTGIGVQIRKDAGSDMLLVVTPIKGSPAYNAHLQTGDIITSITRETDSHGNALPGGKETISTKGMALSDAVKVIQGQRGTKVGVTVQREGESKPLEFEIIRGTIEVDTVLGYRRSPENDEWSYWVDEANKIGYIRLTSFSDNSARHLYRVMNDLTRQGVKGFVLDLRFNPGGLLESAVKISDLFIDDGLIVSIRPRVGREARLNGVHEGSLLDFPMVCLVNGYSASGSEIVGAALQDHKRALVVGERSYGKGSVQNIQDFDGGQIKLTTASFWRPSGKNLNKASTAGKDEDEWGVTPDRQVKLSRKEREELAEALHESEVIPRKDRTPSAKETKPPFKDRQLEEALDYLRGQIKTAARLPGDKAG
jgi:C-terminal peptidase prc